MNKARTLLMLLCGACGLFFCAPRAMSRQVGIAGSVPSAGVEVTKEERKLFNKALRRHVPILKFHREEKFFPLSVRAITNNPGNRLIRVVEGENNDRLLARFPASGDVPKLRITFLRDIYPVLGEPSLERDRVVEQHGEDAQKDYEADADRFQQNSNYSDRVYGRVYYMSEGGKTTAWLQYWLFYYYNDFRFGGEAFGLHEGDWEMVQIKLNSEAEPIRAVYAQHRGGSACSWREMNPAGNHPVVYVARGSHASYFRAGAHALDLPFPNPGEVVRDHADGNGDTIGVSGRRLRLVTLGVNAPPWLNWEGHWGGTREREGFHPSDEPSPRGPKFQGGGKWSNPEAFSQSVNQRQCE
jgi:hypothetical protein